MEAPAEAFSFRVLVGISLTALAVAIFLLFYLRSRHPFFRVPVWRVLIFFLYGAFAAPVLVIATFLLAALPGMDEETALAAFLFIGPIEELAKFAGPFVLVGFVRTWREEPFEWMMAGAAAGTGFAMTENILYALTSAEMFQVLALRSVAPMHLLWSAWLGYRIGRRKPGASGFVWATVSGFLIAAFLHGLWDALCFMGLLGLLLILFGGQLLAFGWHIRKMTWLCADLSPVHPDPVVDAEAAASAEPSRFTCPACAAPCRAIILRGAELFGCPACGLTAVGRGDLYRMVNEYSGTKGWFPIKTWYDFYWMEREEKDPVTCPGCSAPVKARRFLHEDGARIGFCDDCALAVGARSDILALSGNFRSRIKNGFLHG